MRFGFAALEQLSFVRWPRESGGVPSCWGRGLQRPHQGPEWEMALHPGAGLSLLFYLILAVALHPLPPQRSVSEEPEAPLELPQPLSGLLDDYGVLPKHPAPRGPRPLLSPAQQRKREDPDMAEYYYDTLL
ncbi:uncharacterized protein C11orf94 homolog [Sturnira hondurensis]|uniref:uncharacterized protein C11orf94 homolog n=1 Tax=Sturnira hondurensis TaxID=192404 RepID=UPI00187961AF|nr:uncharacterized protein C11orf94 homolog [Sturnira hondurensis]